MLVHKKTDVYDSIKEKIIGSQKSIQGSSDC